ncbi:MAG TPA: DNA methyltransferase [Syntrophorhabdaceae bacterium]|nr:DNA methyltransferase [Syntrophorhabdaceae bacterium]HON85296.1 DNA methyltransferase [Syntrophorhabdaceae bacterium]HOT41662.1 DNA methyltransferase [Syntrophorhabdaceae bacterium]HPP42270.1 DNA methyltransferase [Syntrophorhabdaceae bacterium]HQH42527.1 DNA methyltransferase [Syntrophorhabdaceae bacterium]
MYENLGVTILAKIKFDLRDPDEVFFAQREIDALLNTKTRFIKTIASLMREIPFSLLDEEVVHLMNRLVYLGEGQAYLTTVQPIDVVSIIKRVTFFREIYVIFICNSATAITSLLKRLGLTLTNYKTTEDKIDYNPYTQIFFKDIPDENTKLVCIRFLPFHTLFEYATEVKKLPAAVFRPKSNENWESYFLEKEKGIINGISELIEHLKIGHYRSPHFGLGKNNIGDFVDWASTDLRKPFLHYLHKYKGKGDPRISRALINLLRVNQGDIILDPFMGSGAFIADAPTMGINAIGIEILSIGKMIAQVKCNLGIDIERLREEIIKIFESIDRGFSIEANQDRLLKLKDKIKSNINGLSAYGKIEPHLGRITYLLKEIEMVKDESIRNFLLILLSQQIVEFSEKSRTWDIINSFKSYVEDRYLILYATKIMADILKVDLNGARVNIIKGDSTNMSMIQDNSIDGILTSPPYFDALDYIGNNKTPILILGLDEDLKWESTKKFYDSRHREDIPYEQMPLFVCDRYLSVKLPDSSFELINLLKKSRRQYKSDIVENYLKMMKLSFEECYRVLKQNKHYLMVISKYHLWVINGKEELIETSSILGDLGKQAGFKLVDIIEHGLSKADKGKIGVEDILVFQKL